MAEALIVPVLTRTTPVQISLRTPRLLPEITVESAEKPPAMLLLPLTASFATDVARNTLGNIPVESLQQDLKRNIYALAEHYITQAGTNMVAVNVSSHGSQPSIYELMPSLGSSLNPPDAIKNMQYQGHFAHKVFRDDAGNYCLLMQDTHAPEQTMTVVFRNDERGPAVLKEALVQTAPLDEQDPAEIGEVALGAIGFAAEEIVAYEAKNTYEPQPAPPTPVLLPGRRGREKFADGETEKDQFAPLKAFIYEASVGLTKTPEEAALAAEGILALAQTMIAYPPKRMKQFPVDKDGALKKLALKDGKRTLISRVRKQIPTETRIALHRMIATDVTEFKANPEQRLWMDAFSFFGDDPRLAMYSLVLRYQDRAFVMIYKPLDNIVVVKNKVFRDQPGRRKLAPYDFANIAFMQDFLPEHIEKTYRKDLPEVETIN